MSETETESAPVTLNLADEFGAAFEAGVRAGKAEDSAKERMHWVTHPVDTEVIIPVGIKRDVDGEEHLEPLTRVLDVLDSRCSGPQRRTGTTKLSELDSFIEFIKRWGSPDTVVYADTAGVKLVAVLDDHPPDPHETSASWREHRAEYTAPKSAEWIAWSGRCGRAMRQLEFADFIEEHLEDLVSYDGMPAPTDVLSMARNLHIKTKGTYGRDFDPVTGDSVLTIKSETESGSTKIPRAFMIAIPVFEGGSRYTVEARIRFAISDGSPTFTFVLHRRSEIERHAFMDVRNQVSWQAKVKTGVTLDGGVEKTVSVTVLAGIP